LPNRTSMLGQLRGWGGRQRQSPQRLAPIASVAGESSHAEPYARIAHTVANAARPPRSRSPLASLRCRRQESRCRGTRESQGPRQSRRQRARSSRAVSVGSDRSGRGVARCGPPHHGRASRRTTRPGPASPGIRGGNRCCSSRGVPLRPATSLARTFFQCGRGLG
jgi:hypothetical protein